MVAMRKHLIISLGDMRYVSINCRDCGNSVTLDMTRDSDHQKRFGFTPAICSSCQSPHDTSIKNLNDFRRAYESLLGIAERISFHGESEGAEPSDPASRASSGKD